MKQSRLIRNIKLGIKTLLLHKLRSLLTMLGVMFGVASVIAMLAIGEGSKQQALAEIDKLGATNVLIHSVKPTSAEQASTTRTNYMAMYGLLYEDAERLRQLPSVKKLAQYRQYKQQGWHQGRNMDLRMVGVTPEWFSLVERPLLGGRTLNAGDIAGHRMVCVMTRHTARGDMTADEDVRSGLLIGTEVIGQSILVKGNYFEVVGVVEAESANVGTMATPDNKIDVYIPLNVHRKRFGESLFERTSGSRNWEKVELHGIVAEIRSKELVESTAEAIRSMLSRFHKNPDYRVDVPLRLLRQAEAEQRRWNIVLGSVAGISLLVGGIGIMNIMLASVTERTREIGIRRAIGARKRQIIMQFLIETVVLSVTGGLIGLALGPTIAGFVSAYADMTTIVPMYSIVLSFGISVIVGLVFGTYPAVKAANLDPIEALRHE